MKTKSKGCGCEMKKPTNLKQAKKMDDAHHAKGVKEGSKKDMKLDKALGIIEKGSKVVGLKKGKK